MPPSELVAGFRDSLRAHEHGDERAIMVAVEHALRHASPRALDPIARFSDEAALIADVQRVRGRERRDPLGWVATPPDVAHALVRLLAFAYPEAWRRARTVLDPAAGAGGLLDPIGAGKSGIGWELDPVAVTMANALRPSVRIVRSDGLSTRRPDVRDGRLAVLCNPPYVPAYSRGSLAATMDVPALRATTSGWSLGRQNVAVAFIARVVRDLLAPGEIAGFIVPDALLNGTTYEPFRRALRQHCEDVAVAHTGERVFAGRSVRAVLVACRRSELPLLAQRGDGCAVRFVALDDRPRVLGVLEPASAARLPSGLWPWPRAATPLAFRLQERFPPLGDAFEVADGVNPGPRAARQALLRDEPDGLVQPVAVCEGRDVHADGLAAPSRYLETAPAAWRTEWRAKGASLRAPGLFVGPRLYSRQTTARLKVAYVDGPAFALNSVHVIRCRPSAVRAGDVRMLHPERTALLRLAAVLNTPSMTAIYQALFDEDRAAFPQVKVANLRALPLPWPLDANEPVDAAVIRTADAWADAPCEASLHHVDAAVAMWLTARCSGGAVAR